MIQKGRVLEHQSVTVNRYRRRRFTIEIVLGGTIKVAIRNNAVDIRLRRVQSLGVAMFLDEDLAGDPKYLSPDFTNGMNTPISWIVKGLVRRWVNGHILKKKNQDSKKS